MTLNSNFRRTLMLALGITAWAAACHGAPITDFFTLRNNAATTLSGTGNTNDPLLGTLSTTAAAARMIGYFPEQTLTNVGDKITFSFSLEFFDNDTTIGNGSDNFRFALYDRNGETPEATNSNIAVTGTSNTDAFRGYWFGVNTDGGGPDGTIRERSGTTGHMDPFANASAQLLSAPGGTDVSFDLGETYAGSMTLTLSDLNEVTISGSFSGSNGGENVFSFVDDSPVTTSYSVVGFLNGGGLNADQIQFQNIDVTYVPIPEPATGMLALFAFIGGAFAWRRG